MKKKRLSAVLLLFLFSGTFLYADVVFLKNGTQVRGKIISAEKNLVTLLPEDNTPIKLIDTLEIDSITYDDGRKVAISNKGNKEIFPYKEIFKKVQENAPSGISKPTEPENNHVKSSYSYEGFFVGLNSGLGYGSSKVQALKYYKYSGLGLPLGISAGIGFNHNWLLSAHYSMFSMKAKKLETNSTTVPTDSGDQIIIYNQYGLGISYYILPINIFFTFSSGIHNIRYKSGVIQGKTPNALFASLSLGKKWKITESLSFSIALQGNVYQVSDFDNSLYKTSSKNTLYGLILQCAYKI